MSRRRVNRLLITSAIGWLTAVSALSAQPHEPRLRGTEAKAVCVALGAFQKLAPKVDLRHYSVYVEKQGKNFHISFVPDQFPGEFVAGGGTKYGAEIGYVISHRTLKILEQHFTR
ncbi:MAG: hypothetical protein QOG67_599 [Verrucomicrobiota bacterium]